MESTTSPAGVLVLTSGFESAHGRAPRGRGAWAFYLGTRDDVLSLFWFTGLYGDAKREAQHAAAATGKTFVTVAS